MRIDEYDFEKTAKTVFAMNPSLRENHMNLPTWEDVREFMINMAYTHCHKSNSFSTGGFQLTAFDGSDGERHVRASVSSSLAYEYVEKLRKLATGSW